MKAGYRFSDSEKEFLSQIRKDINMVSKSIDDLFDVIVGEIKVYPTNEELDSIVEPLYKFYFIKRQWKVTVSN